MSIKQVFLIDSSFIALLYIVLYNKSYMKKILLLSLSICIICTSYISDVSAATCYNVNFNASFGMRDNAQSNNVSVIQQFLREFNFLAPGPSGFFGPSTLAAVRSFQATYRISPVSGFVGPMTRAKIREVSCSGAPISPIINPIVNPPQSGNVIQYSQNNLSTRILYEGRNVIYR
jgi:hypothetical protein